MVIKPKVRGFICTNAHPDGCEKSVKNQIEYINNNAYDTASSPKKCAGHRMFNWIRSSFSDHRSFLGTNAKKHWACVLKKVLPRNVQVLLDFYNTAAFSQNFAKEQQRYAKTLNGDAFSDEIKQQCIELIKEDLGQVDLVIYSLASPRRVDPVIWWRHTSRRLNPLVSHTLLRPMTPIRIRFTTLR